MLGDSLLCAMRMVRLAAVGTVAAIFAGVEVRSGVEVISVGRVAKVGEADNSGEGVSVMFLTGRAVGRDNAIHPVIDAQAVRMIADKILPEHPLTVPFAISTTSFLIFNIRAPDGKCNFFFSIIDSRQPHRSNPLGGFSLRRVNGFVVLGRVAHRRHWIGDSILFERDYCRYRQFGFSIWNVGHPLVPRTLISRCQ